MSLRDNGEERPRLRVGVVGVNERIRRVVLPGLMASENAELTAICSRSAEKAAAVASILGGIVPYTRYSDMLRYAPIDAVIIETPPKLHHPMALLAIEQGKHVICEKPLAASVAEAREMTERAKAAGVRTAVNFTYRSAGPLRHLADLLASDGDESIGDLVSFTLSYSQARGLFPETPRLRALEDLGPHLLDLLLWFSGAASAGTVESICSAERALPRDDPSLAINQVCWSGLARLTGGAVGSVEATRAVAATNNTVRAQFAGTRGALRVEFEATSSRITRATLGDGRPDGVWREIALPPEYDIAFSDFPAVHFDRLVRALLGEESFPDFAQGLAVQKVQSAAQLSSKEGRWVRVEESV